MPESKEILDNTGVHPEAYEAAESLLTLCGYTKADVAKGNISQLQTRLEEIGIEEAAQRCGVGVPTLQDVAKELQN